MNLSNRIGLFGGTFSPLHNAHMLVARKALAQFGLSEVLFVPSGCPPHKAVEGRVSKEHRYEMVRQVVEQYEKLNVSRIELDREGRSYTIDTLEKMKEIHGSDGVCFIVGADLLAEIDTWKSPGKLLRSVPFIIAPRNKHSRKEFVDPVFEDASLSFLDMEKVDLSSTWVRDQIVKGKEISDVVPAQVVEYIEGHGLYKEFRELGDNMQCQILAK